MSLGNIQYLTKSNFRFYCAQHYENPDNPDDEELEKDLKHITYIKRLISDYADRGVIRDRMILNYIITLANLFGPEHAVRILFFKVEDRYYPALKTFLKFLNFMPPSVTGLKKKVVNGEIPTDVELYGRLLLL